MAFVDMIKSNFPLVVISIISLAVIVAIMSICIQINTALAPQKIKNSSKPHPRKHQDEDIDTEIDKDISTAKIVNMISLVTSAIMIVGFFCIFLCSLKK